MPKLIDTHAHIDFELFQEDFEKVLAMAKEADVEKIIIPGVVRDDFDRIIDFIEKYDNLYGAIAIHPSEAKSWDDESYETLKKFAGHKKVVAIGETGLDYYWDKTFNDVQQYVFREHIRLAKELNKPVIVHDRDAHEDTLNILKEMNVSETGVIMHCFSGSAEFAKLCTKEGFHLALGGPVTFKNAKKPKEVAASIDLDKLLLETDSPYLTPHPYRGKVNYPSYVKLVAQEIASIRNISYEEVAATTTKNAKNIFKI